MTKPIKLSAYLFYYPGEKGQSLGDIKIELKDNIETFNTEFTAHEFSINKDGSIILTFEAWTEPEEVYRGTPSEFYD